MMVVSEIFFSQSLACTLMIWTDHNKDFFQSKSTYFDGRNKKINLSS